MSSEAPNNITRSDLQALFRSVVREEARATALLLSEIPSQSELGLDGASNDESQSVTTELTLFSEIPREIRCMIWKLTFKPQDIRIRRVCEYPLSGIDVTSTGLGLNHRVVRPYIHPVALMVDKLSRDYALKHYKLILHQTAPCNFVYMNPKLDTLCLDSMEYDLFTTSTITYTLPVEIREVPHSLHVFKAMLHNDYENLKDAENIAINAAAWHPGLTAQSYTDGPSYKAGAKPAVADGFQNLKNIFLVADDSTEAFWRVHARATCGLNVIRNWQSYGGRPYIQDYQNGIDLCTSQIQDLYREERLRNGQCSVPKVTIYEVTDPDAPKFSRSPN